MYIIKEKKFILIPLAYNEFCNDIKSLSDSPKYEGEIQIERIIGSCTVESIVEYCNRDKDATYVIDMKNIVLYENKIFKKLLELDDAKIIIVNIKDSLIESIKEDLNNKYEQIDVGVLCSNDSISSAYNDLKTEINNIYHKETVAIVQWMRQCVTKENVKDIKPLDSSGVYCNMYINAKQLFIAPDKYCFIIYQMICAIVTSTQRIDALVSASRNGANIACVIGWLLNKKVIHCTSLGPKFSLATNMVYKDIRKNNKYAYIFDFMCLGTEAKLLNAILNSKGAILVEGFGIANYINLDGNSGLSVLGRMKSLVDVQNENFGYKIAGSKEEIEDMLIEECDDYVSGICRV